MTTVYGVTYIGAREQIEKRLIEQGELDVEDAWQASAYLARKVRARVRLFVTRTHVHSSRYSTASVISSLVPKVSSYG